MLSRAADSLYWMARNIERAENNVRLLDVNLTSMLEDFDHVAGVDNSYWQKLLRINGNLDLFNSHYDKCDTPSVMEFLCFSTNNPTSILQCVEIARENARTIRGMIPQEMWELLNSIYLNIRQYPVELWEMDHINELFQLVRDQSLHFQGIVSAVMSRGDAYTFIKMGKNIERAEKISRILDVYFKQNEKAQELADQHLWSSVLHSVSGHEAYLEEFGPFLEPERVVDFLVFKSTFPRSIRYSIDQLVEALNELEHGRIRHYNRELSVTLGRLDADLKYGSMEEVLHQGSHKFFQNIQDRCQLISNLICKTYYMGELEVK